MIGIKKSVFVRYLNNFFFNKAYVSKDLNKRFITSKEDNTKDVTLKPKPLPKDFDEASCSKQTINRLLQKHGTNVNIHPDPQGSSRGLRNDKKKNSSSTKTTTKCSKSHIEIETHGQQSSDESETPTDPLNKLCTSSDESEYEFLKPENLYKKTSTKRKASVDIDPTGKRKFAKTN